MKIVELKDGIKYLKDYIKLCSLEWGVNKTSTEMEQFIQNRYNEIIKNDYDKLITILFLVDNDILIGFISLFKYDNDERKDLTPWYATMYVKEEYRNKGYSKILNDALLKKAKDLGYDRIYLKSDLVNYYEKFGAKYLSTLKNNENLYYIDL